METTNDGADFGRSKSRKMKLKSLKTRDDMLLGVDREEDYHAGVSASVPFVWESEPGTPKDKGREKEKEKEKYGNDGGVFSPLTPPPSYFSPSQYRHSKSLRNNSKSSRTNFLNTVFRKLSVKASLHPPSLPSSSSSSSSSSLSSSTTTTPNGSGRERGRTGSPRRLSFEWKMDDQEEEEEEEEEVNDNEESPVSTLFFGRRVNGRGCCPKLVKVFARDVK